MTKKTCCCSSVLSCFSCFSDTNAPVPVPAPTSPSSAPPSASPCTPFEPAKDDIVPRVLPKHDILPHHDSKVVSVASSSSQPDTSAPHNVGEGGSSSSKNDDTTLQMVPDLTNKIEKDVGVANVDLNGLIKHISELLEIIEAKKSLPQRPQRAQDFLPTTSKSFNKLKEFLSEAINVAKDVIPGDAIKTVVDGVVLGMGVAHMVTTGFVVVANILEKFEDVGDNKNECMSLLKEMIFLAKLVKQFQERPNLKETEGISDVIKEATKLIVEGSILCCSQMKSSKFSKFWAASVNKEELFKFRQSLISMYTTHMIPQMSICNYDVNAPQKPRLARGYPDHAVGMEDAVKEVVGLLQWGSEQKAVAVMLHGFGGMGKTTLGDAVFSRTNFEGCEYSEVQLFKNIESKPDIIELQKCILKDLMVSEETIKGIRKYEDGQRELGYILEKVPAFIYIDNVLGEKELRQLLPRDFNKAKKVRLLLTARDEIVGRAFPLKTDLKIYKMKNISKGAAMSLLKRDVLDDMEGKQGKLNPNQIDNIIKKCGGVPLMLTLVAKVLSFEEDKQKAYNMVMVKGQTFEAIGVEEDYFFAYDSLPNRYKDPFLDVCLFFKGWEWDIVAHIIEEFELDILEKRALITKGIDEAISIHDVILTIGHQKAQGTRFKFTSANQFDEFLHQHEEKDNQDIKGIWLHENKDPLTIFSSKLDLMYKSLRVLHFGNFSKVEGQCNKKFENLVFLSGGITELPFHHMSKLKELRYLAYEPEDLALPKMPSLRFMRFDQRVPYSSFQISSTCLQQLGNLRTLRLMNYTELKKLPEEIGDQVKFLQELSLSYCKSLKELPRSISRLQSLRVLRMDYCSSLRTLLEDFGSLKSLQELDLQGCVGLKKLGEDFGSLNSLQELNLQGCTGLKELPNNFEKLSSLRSLDLSSCEKLKHLPHDLGNLSSLVTLNFHKCHNVKSIPDSIGQLKLTHPFLDMSHCLTLSELPDGFCNLSFINYLALSKCESLHSLPNRFGELASLRRLYLEECSSLQKLPESFGRLKYLETLDLTDCQSLEELCNEFHGLTSLHTLYLKGCKNLKKLPEDFHCLFSLQNLRLDFCRMLEGKSMDKVLKIKALKNVYIQGSGMLLERWAEIQSERPTIFTDTDEDVSTEEESIENNILPHLESLLSEGRQEPIHLSAPLLFIVFDYDLNPDFPWPLIEETIDDIQINFEIVYVGVNFDTLPPKVKNIIVGHLDILKREAEVRDLASKLEAILDSQAQEHMDEEEMAIVRMRRMLEDEEDGKLAIVQMSMLEDEEDGECRPCWKLLKKDEMEEFLLCNCKKYLQLKQLIETSQESAIKLLRELFAAGEGEICTFQKAPSGNSKPLTCTAEELKGKTIILEIRPIDVPYDMRLASLTDLYNTEKDTFNLEIISIPLVQRGTSVRIDAYEKISRDIPWLVIQNPWVIPTAVKYFLINLCAPHERELSCPSRIKIIESNGKIFQASEPVLRLLDVWGSKAYPFTVQNIKNLKEEEWKQMKTMSTLEFLFKGLERLSDQVKEKMLHQKVVCLYGGPDQRMEEYTCSIRNAFIGLTDSINIIYIPRHNLGASEGRLVTYTLIMSHEPMEMPALPSAEMDGMLLINLSEHDIFKFWRRIWFLQEKMTEINNCDTDQSGAMKRLFQCWGSENQSQNRWMILMDEEGKIITESGEKIVLPGSGSMEDKAKGLIELLVKGSKEQRSQALLDLKQLTHKSGQCVIL